jgi:hypothetical protein
MKHHEIQYWITCPKCGHQVEVKKEVRPLRDGHCDKCNLLFSFTIEELAAAEGVATIDLGLLRPGDPVQFYADLAKPRPVSFSAFLRSRHVSNT